jgi:hypothetical protein
MGMQSSIIVFVLVFTTLGLLLGYAAAYDFEKTDLPDSIEERDPVVQQQQFNDCIRDAGLDGELTDDEYNGCAYDIYD